MPSTSPAADRGAGSRHPRCGGVWRGPFDLDDGPVEVCNTCGEERPVTSVKLTARQAADRIGVSVRQLSRYVAAGLITPERTPGGHRRFASDDVDRLLASR